MVTLKQLETFYWIAKLGTIQRAADRLFVTQSAATKRLQGIESQSALPVFDRTGRKLMLTRKGQEIASLCEELLEAVGYLHQLQDPIQHAGRVVRIGVTEVVVLTWFHLFLGLVRKRHPKIALQPEVDLSDPLREKVLGGQLDLAILPEPEADHALARVELGRERFSWICPPDKFAEDKVVPLSKLAEIPIIEQTARSIITVLSSRMFGATGAQPNRIQGGNSIIAIGGLIEVGIGASCLPVSLFADHIAAGRMRALATDPPAPDVRYEAIFLRRPYSPIGNAMAEIAREAFGTYSSSHRG